MLSVSTVQPVLNYCIFTIKIPADTIIHSNDSGQLNVVFLICNMPFVIVLPFQYSFALSLHILVDYKKTYTPLKITTAVYQPPMSFSDIQKSYQNKSEFSAV